MSSSSIRFDLEIAWDMDIPSGTAFTATGGKGGLWVGDTLVWGKKTKAGYEGVHWHWVDLLVFLSEQWWSLRFELDYPLGLRPMAPDSLRLTAEKDWKERRRLKILDEERYLDEEEKVFNFEYRHNLSSALQGLYVDNVFILRDVNDVIVCGSGFYSRFKLSYFFEELERIGDLIAGRLTELAGTDEVATKVIKSWQNRETPFSLDRAARFVGSPVDYLRSIANDNNLDSFYSDGSPIFGDTLILSAARMASGASLSPQNARTIIDIVRQHTRQPTPALDLDRQSLRHILGISNTPAEDGRAIASELRKILRSQQVIKKGAIAFDPEAIIRRWGIPIVDISLNCPDADAFVCWSTDYGPIIIMNSSSNRHRKATGKRSSLAHEMCHLIADMDSTLPFAEVINGKGAAASEKRARGFAAEILAPREKLVAKYLLGTDVRTFVLDMADKYKTSSEIIAWQLFRSEVGGKLSRLEKDKLNEFVSSELGLS